MGQIATLKYIFEKLDHSTPNGQNFRHATPNGLKPFYLEDKILMFKLDLGMCLK